jgi:DNA polymerase-3 subunit delta'
VPFRDIAGHKRLVALLARSVGEDALPPSLIFAGPRGVGKRATAVAVAQALNCLAPIKSEVRGPLDLFLDACGTCGACLRIARGVHPDVVVLEPGDTGSIRVDEVREVIGRTAYRPFEGRRRVVIVDEADALVDSAQNALLKTLEEPPPSSVFILITTRPDALLPTVQSRCPRLRFPSVGREEIEAADREVAARVLAAAASARDDRGRLEVAKDLLAGTGAGGAADRERLGSHLLAMASLLRDAELLWAGGDRGALANADAAPALDRLARAYQGDRGLSAFAAVDRALAALDRNAASKIVADWIVLQL